MPRRVSRRRFCKGGIQLTRGVSLARMTFRPSREYEFRRDETQWKWSVSTTSDSSKAYLEEERRGLMWRANRTSSSFPSSRTTVCTEHSIWITTGKWSMCDVWCCLSIRVQNHFSSPYQDSPTACPTPMRWMKLLKLIYNAQMRPSLPPCWLAYGMMGGDECPRLFVYSPSSKPRPPRRRRGPYSTAEPYWYEQLFAMFRSSLRMPFTVGIVVP